MKSNLYGCIASMSRRSMTCIHVAKHRRDLAASQKSNQKEATGASFFTRTCPRCLLHTLQQTGNPST
ncbi:unnamed protein product [Symbiodinium natans]|uniref:Uncharacterized protein n=1 Tax=Symbiodinium natans TaxID=878477 RepID=A0A812U8H7_9DINO|nr:unnamed protein product [Symbiodinium natans]